jgi:hypothetical protein
MGGRPLEAEDDLAGIGARSKAEIVFELTLGAVVNQIDSGINSAYCTDSRNSRWMPGD